MFNKRKSFDDSSEIMANFSENLIYLFKKHSIQKVAEKSGINRSQIYRYINCETTPSIFVLKRIAENLNVTMDWLLTQH